MVPQARVYFKSSESMPELEENSVQSIVTSPPYWSTKDYDAKGQIGYGESYEIYHNRLEKVWRECFRVLKPTGTAWIVLGTVFNRGRLLLLPYDVMWRMKLAGFTSVEVVVWYKPTLIAGLTLKNLLNKQEFVLVVAKDRYRFKLFSESCKGVDTPKCNLIMGEGLSNIWRIPRKAGTTGYNINHKAPYPEQLVEHILALSTQPGDLVLDPFLGSGTTIKVALEMGRSGVGYEINQGFREMIERRLEKQAVQWTL